MAQPEGNNINYLRDKAKSELDKAMGELEAVQAKARKITEANQERADLHRQIQAMKVEIGIKSDAYGELARAAALAAGGTNHRPPR